MPISLTLLASDAEKLGASGSAAGRSFGKVTSSLRALDDVHIKVLYKDGSSSTFVMSRVFKGDAGSSFKNISDAVVRDPAAARADMEALQNDLDAVVPMKPSDQGPAGARDAKGNLRRNSDGSFSTPEQASWPSRVLNTMKNNPGKTFLGISVVTMISVVGAMLGCTDGVQVPITHISIVPNTSNTQIEVTYTPPTSVGCVAGMFRPRLHDTFTFSSTTTTPILDGMGSCEVVKVPTDSSVIVKLPQQLTSAGTGVPSWGNMTCQSSFEHQLGGFVSDMITTVVATTISVLSNTLPAVFQGFCDAAPNFCQGLGNIPTWIKAMCGFLSCALCALLVFFLVKK